MELVTAQPGRKRLSAISCSSAHICKEGTKLDLLPHVEYHSTDSKDDGLALCCCDDLEVFHMFWEEMLLWHLLSLAAQPQGVLQDETFLRNHFTCAPLFSAMSFIAGHPTFGSLTA